MRPRLEWAISSSVCLLLTVSVRARGAPAVGAGVTKPLFVAGAAPVTGPAVAVDTAHRPPSAAALTRAAYGTGGRPSPPSGTGAQACPILSFFREPFNDLFQRIPQMIFPLYSLDLSDSCSLHIMEYLKSSFIEWIF